MSMENETKSVESAKEPMVPASKASEEELNGLTYRELQKQAKQFGIKANLPKRSLIAAISEAKPDDNEIPPKAVGKALDLARIDKEKFAEKFAEFHLMMEMANYSGENGLFSLVAQSLKKLEAEAEANRANAIQQIERLEAVAEANRRNVIQLSNTILDLSQELAEARSTIATLTKETVVNETCEREEESKKVFLRNVPRDMVRKIGGRRRNLSSSVNFYVKSLTRSILTSFDERDIRHTKIVSVRNQELSILINFASSSDAQKFKHRLDLREGCSVSMRAGKTRLQRWNSVRPEVPESVDECRTSSETLSSPEVNDGDLANGPQERRVRFALLEEGSNKEKLQRKVKRQPDDPWGAWNEFVKPGPILNIPLIQVTPMTNPPPTEEVGGSSL